MIYIIKSVFIAIYGSRNKNWSLVRKGEKKKKRSVYIVDLLYLQDSIVRFYLRGRMSNSIITMTYLKLCEKLLNLIDSYSRLVQTNLLHYRE